MDVGVGSAATVITSTKGGVVRALCIATGNQDWATALQGTDPVTGFALTQDHEENVVVVSRESDLYALNPKNGAILWRYPHASSSMVNRKCPRPAIWGNYVFHVREGDKLVAISLANGREEWNAGLDASTLSSPTVGGKTVYIGTGSGSVYAFSQK
jgi:outer membrane protein assembly factor BamB